MFWEWYFFKPKSKILIIFFLELISKLSIVLILTFEFVSELIFVL